MANNKLNDGGFVKNIVSNLTDNALSNFSSILSIKPIGKYASGARCILRINGQLVGFAFNVSWNIETSVTEIRTIDNYNPHELTPKHVNVSGSIGALHIPGAGPSKARWQSAISNFLHQKYITIEVRDSQSDNLLFFTNKALVTSRREVMQVENLSEIMLEFKAIGWKDELEPPKVDSKTTGAPAKQRQDPDDVEKPKPSWRNKAIPKLPI